MMELDGMHENRVRQTTCQLLTKTLYAMRGRLGGGGRRYATLHDEAISCTMVVLGERGTIRGLDTFAHVIERHVRTR